MTSAALAMLLLAGGPAYDPGGDMIATLTQVRETRGEVAIGGICLSACALKLAANRVCVSPSAQVGVHEVRRSVGLDYERGTRDELATGFYRQTIPECARRLFDRLGGFTSGRLVTLSGSEILAACPGMRACD